MAESSSTPDGRYLRTEFLQRIAHELRGPAGVTAGALDEIELALGTESEKLSSLFLMARRGIHRVLRSADRLQRTAELETGRIEWVKAPADLRALVKKAASDAEYLEGRRSVRLDVSGADEACMVVVDAEWLSKAIAETVANAIRFARGRVTVDTRVDHAEARIVITDDGAGFSGPPPVALFTPPAGKRGLGLSLPLVLEVVTAHGGRFEVGHASKDADSPPSGARVVLVLPLQGKSPGEP